MDALSEEDAATPFGTTDESTNPLGSIYASSRLTTIPNWPTRKVLRCRVPFLLAALLALAAPALVQAVGKPDQKSAPTTSKTALWVAPLNARGHNLSPRFLMPESHWSASEGRHAATPPGGAAPISAFLFLEAEDFAQALQIAKAHPAVAFGARIEVRARAAPPPHS